VSVVGRKSLDVSPCNELLLLPTPVHISRHLEFIIEQGHRVNWVSGSLDSRVTGSVIQFHVCCTTPASGPFYRSAAFYSRSSATPSAAKILHKWLLGTLILGPDFSDCVVLTETTPGDTPTLFQPLHKILLCRTVSLLSQNRSFCKRKS